MPKASERGGGRGGRDREDNRGSGSGRAAPKGGGGFSYRGRTSEDVSRRAKQSSGRYDSFLNEEVVWFKPRDGENRIRIIPWLNGSDPDFDKLNEKWGNHWGIDLIVHRNVGADRGSYLCLDKMNGEPCPVCEVWRTESEDALKPSDRVLCWLVDRDDEKAGPKLWAMPLGTSKDISAVSQVKGSGELLLIDDPEEGYDVYFDREGEKKRTQYKRVEIAREPSPLHENENKQDTWLDYVSDNRLPDLLKFYDPEYLDKVLSGQAVGKDDDEDADSKDTRRGGRRGAADDDDGGRSSRGDRDEPRGRGRGADDDAEVTRPARGGRRGAAEPEEEPPGETEGRGSRRAGGRSRASEDDQGGGRRRGRGAEPEPDPDDPEPDDETGNAGRGGSRRAARGASGGNTERYRGREAEPEAEPEPDAEEDTTAARGRLQRVGRRGGR